MADPENLILTVPLSTDPSLRRRCTLINQDPPANVRFGQLLVVLDKVA